MRRAAGALLRSLPLPGRPVPRSAQSFAEKPKRHATEFAEARDERRGDNAAGGEVVWRVRWRQHGRNRARTFSTRRDARDFDAEVRRQRRAGGLAALDAGAETLGEYVTGAWAASHAATLAPKTRLHYAGLYDYHVRRYLGSIALVR